MPKNCIALSNDYHLRRISKKMNERINYKPFLTHRYGFYKQNSNRLKTLFRFQQGLFYSKGDYESLFCVVFVLYMALKLLSWILP